jgi:hypothetical protein
MALLKHGSPPPTSAADTKEASKRRGIIQKDGKYFVSCPGKDDEPISEFEVRRLIGGIIERAAIDEAVDELAKVLAKIGVELPPEVRQQVADRTHRAARKAGITKTGSAPKLDKLFK